MKTDHAEPVPCPRPVGAKLGAVAHGLPTTSMTTPERPDFISATHQDHLGHTRAEQEKGRGTLQTSALPLGYNRLLAAGAGPQLAVNIVNGMTRDSIPQWNRTAELRGTEHPGEVVILGAHLDSWDLGTGATDNGTGALFVLEAAGVIAQSGLRPKRTIRLIFTGRSTASSA